MAHGWSLPLTPGVFGPAEHHIATLFHRFTAGGRRLHRSRRSTARSEGAAHGSTRAWSPAEGPDDSAHGGSDEGWNRALLRGARGQHQLLARVLDTRIGARGARRGSWVATHPATRKSASAQWDERLHRAPSGLPENLTSGHCIAVASGSSCGVTTTQPDEGLREQLSLVARR